MRSLNALFRFRTAEPAGRPPLTEGEVRLMTELSRHVEVLSVEIGERNVFRRPEALKMAALYIESCFTAAGHEVSRQTYRASGEECHNIVVEIPGTEEEREVVVIGAHYDSVADCPGANDNGTGVAAVLSLAGVFAGTSPRKTIRFVAFVNEEPPFFMTEEMGSRVYARSCKEKGECIAAMLSLETMGCFSDERGSQSYPFPLSLFYPDTGNFIGFVANTRSSALLKKVLASYETGAGVPAVGGAYPSMLPGVGWSDHWSFWKEGYPALMVTDTALYRYEYYHTPDDTADRLDYEGLAFVVSGLQRVAAELAGVELPT